MHTLRRLHLGPCCFVLCWLASSAAGQASQAARFAESALVEPAVRTLHSWSEATQLMDAHQPELIQQRAAITRAKASVEQALARLLPRLELGVGVDFSPIYRRTGTSDRAAEHVMFDGRSVIPNANASLSVTFSIADYVLLDSAHSGVDAERVDLAATRHALIGSLASTVLGVLAAERVAARNLAGLEAAEQRMRLTERLVALGRATSLDALRFSQDLSEAQNAVISANETLSQVREDLGQALGLAEPIAVTPELDIGFAAVGCRPLARLEDRSDRRAAHERAEQAALSSRAADLAYLPELRVVSQYEASYGGFGLRNPYEAPREVDHRWTASANLVWTVYEGGVRSADELRARAETADARAAEDVAANASVTEYRRAKRLVAVTRASLDIAEQSLEAARQADSLSRKALELGSASALEVVDAARRLRAVESALATREVDWLAAKIRAQLSLADCGG